jgi:predicted methyltransferase
VGAQKSLLILLGTAFLWAGAAIAREPESDRVDRGTSDPYTGDLSIFEEKGRAKKLQIDRVMDLLGIKAGSSVADIGAGSGWFTVRSARRVGKDGVVYAVEINRNYIRHIERRAKREKLANIRAVLGKPEDPRLSPNSIDAVLLLKTYHEIEEPIRFMRRLRDALRPGALVGVIERKGIGTDHGVNADIVIAEAARAGYELVEQHDFVKSSDVDYFLVFR